MSGRSARTIVGLLCLVLATLSAQAAPTDVGPLIRITGETPFPDACGGDGNAFFGERFASAEVEPMVAVNPRDPQNIIATWFQDASLTYMVASSKNAGDTWTTATVPGITRCDGGSAQGAADSWLSIGPDGTAYLAGFSVFLDAYPPAPLPTRTTLNVSRSTDGGSTWSEPRIVLSGAVLFHDRPIITADPERAGTAYVVWNEGTQVPTSPEQPLFFSRTDDFAETWSTPVPVYAPAGGVVHDAKTLALPTGELLVVAALVRSFPLSHLVVALRSGDGGRTWSLPTTIAQIPAGHYPSPPGDCRGPNAAVRDTETGQCVQANEYELSSDISSVGTVYAVWRHPLSDTRSVIRVARSSDAGRTWSEPRDASTATSHVFLPALAVTKTDGAIGVTFYDLRSDRPGDDALSAEMWFSHSHDDGSTWEETKIAGPFDLRTAPLRLIPTEGLFLGDYQGLAALPDGFVSVFALPKPFAISGTTDLFFARLRTS